MTLEQGIVLGVIVLIFGLFAWGKWRYDVVAVIGLLALVIADVFLEQVLRRGESQLIDPAHALDGFGHAAVITVAAVLVISRALRNSGVVDLIARRIMPFAKNQLLHIASLCVVAMVLSAAGVVTFNLISSQNPSTIAANIALNYANASGTKTNVLIAGGLVLFVVTFAVNFLGRWLAARGQVKA